MCDGDSRDTEILNAARRLDPVARIPGDGLVTWKISLEARVSSSALGRQCWQLIGQPKSLFKYSDSRAVLSVSSVTQACDACLCGEPALESNFFSQHPPATTIAGGRSAIRNLSRFWDFPLQAGASRIAPFLRWWPIKRGSPQTEVRENAAFGNAASGQLGVFTASEVRKGMRHPILFSAISPRVDLRC